MYLIGDLLALLGMSFNILDGDDALTIDAFNVNVLSVINTSTKGLALDCL